MNVIVKQKEGGAVLVNARDDNEDLKAKMCCKRLGQPFMTCTHNARLESIHRYGAFLCYQRAYAAFEVERDKAPRQSVGRRSE